MKRVVAVVVVGAFSVVGAVEAAPIIKTPPRPPPPPPAEPSPFSHRVERHPGSAENDVEDRPGRLAFEVGVGVGVTRVDDVSVEPASHRSLAISLGLGTWLDPQNQLSVRIATGTFQRDTMDARDVTTTGVFAGPTIVHFFGSSATTFAGAGLGVLAMIDADEHPIATGLDLRLGRRQPIGAAALYAAAELTVGLTEDGATPHVGLQVGVMY